TAEALLRTTLTGHGITLEESSTADILKATMFIGNVAPDEGLSAPFNGWMTLFGQFFDHGLDLVAKGGYGTVYIPLQPDDPLYVEGSSTNFMALTRSTLDPVSGEPINLTTPFVDQNQTYTSTPSAQVFHREYEMRFDAELGYAVPKATGRLLNGDGGGLATWADVKAQALNMLGIELDDHDIHRIPELLVDPYGNFVPGANGLPQIVTGIDGNGQPVTTGAVVDGNGVITSTVAAADALATGHAFLDDIAHNANPGAGEAADLDNAVGLTGSNNGFYDDELLDAHFITGDGRGNENIGLTAVHQVFHSEHNRQVDLVQALLLSEAQDLLANGASEADAVAFLNQWLDIPLTGVDPGDIAAELSAATVASLDWNGERIFQAAKLPTEMQYQHL
ncbi:MAG: peroxidase family protein, partial [Hyphomicrobium sp.]